MIVGCYSMDLYCANQPSDTCKGGYMSGAWQFTGQTEAECKREARSKGWRFTKGDTTCPHCNRAARSSTAPGQNK